MSEVVTTAEELTTPRFPEEAPQQPQTNEELVQIIYDKVIALQHREFGRTWPRDIDDAIMKYVMYIHVEADELLSEINFKFHKPKHEINMKHVRLEIADLLIYVFAVSGVAFKDLNDLLQTVKEKQDYNEVRQDWNSK
jgi:NTP pyrophosphatase (non-canonical NTP hydrolase)